MPTTTDRIGCVIKSFMMDPNDFSSPLASVRNTLNTTMAVPSFTSDSPSMRCPSVLLAPTSFKMATTATGSVAANIEPTIMQNDQLSPKGNARNTHPARPIVINTPGPAMTSTFGNTFFNVCHSIENDDSKINAGRNAASNTCGLMFPHASSDDSNFPKSR